MKDIDISRPAQVGNRIIPWYGNIEPEPADPVDFWSPNWKTPVYSPLLFLKVSGTSRDNSLETGGGMPADKILLRVDTVLISVTLQRNIVKTQVPRKNGTVKEFIGEDDFRVSIKGAIVSPYPLVFPRDEVKLLTELCRLSNTNSEPKPLPVTSDFLLMFGIHNIVVENYNISEKLGSRNEVPFEIEALSAETEADVETAKQVSLRIR